MKPPNGKPTRRGDRRARKYEPGGTGRRRSLGPCTRDSAHGVAEVPWSGERLCWPCADTALDHMAQAREIAGLVQVGTHPPWGVVTYSDDGTCPCGQAGCPVPGETASDRLAEALAGAYLAMAGGDPELAAELARGSNYLKQMNCC